MASLGFDTRTAEPMRDFSEPIPAGDYVVVMVESERKPTKAGTGEYLKCVWEVVKGEHKGRKLFANYNIANPNPDAERIGRAEITAACRACGKPNATDTAELHKIPIVVKVAVQKKSDGSGELENRIKAYHPKDGGLPPAAKAADEPVKPLPKDESDPF